MNLDTSKKTDGRQHVWQVNLQRLLSSNLTQAATGSSWPGAACVIPLMVKQARRRAFQPLFSSRRAAFA